MWDFCRAVDDAVDEATGRGAGRAAARSCWRQEIARVFEAPRPQSPQGQALSRSPASFDLPRVPFEDLIDGVQMDLGHRRYETFDDLRGVLLARRLDGGPHLPQHLRLPRTRAARDYAMNLGLALQLTNIVRDVKADLEQGRVYLPQDELRRFGCTEAGRCAAGAVTPGRCRALLRAPARARPDLLRARGGGHAGR